jgi:hypothetical protein
MEWNRIEWKTRKQGNIYATVSHMSTGLEKSHYRMDSCDDTRILRANMGLYSAYMCKTHVNVLESVQGMRVVAISRNLRIVHAHKVQATEKSKPATRAKGKLLQHPPKPPAHCPFQSARLCQRCHLPLAAWPSSTHPCYACQDKGFASAADQLGVSAFLHASGIPLC